MIAERIAAQQVLPALGHALAGGRPRSRRAELRDVIGELFDTLARNKTGLKLIDRSARDLPELADLWFGGARGTLVAALRSYLERLPRSAPLPDPTVAARFVVETCVFWAVHRHWDAEPIAVDEPTARAAVVDLVTTALLGTPS
jgi:hypothetical protein